MKLFFGPHLSLSLGKGLLLRHLLLQHSGERGQVEAEERVEGVLLLRLRHRHEHLPGELLHVVAEREVGLVEGQLLLPGQPLPRVGVGPGVEAELSVPDNDNDNEKNNDMTEETKPSSLYLSSSSRAALCLTDNSSNLADSRSRRRRSAWRSEPGILLIPAACSFFSFGTGVAGMLVVSRGLWVVNVCGTKVVAATVVVWAASVAA